MSELGAGLGSSYPTSLDTDSSVEVNDGGATPTLARAECINDANDAIVKIETELGANPSGAYATVAARFDALTPVQVVHTETGAVATGTTVIPTDDSIPQKTEGDELMTLEITPRSASNILVIEAVATLSHNYAGAADLTIALFQDTTAGALATQCNYSPGQYFMSEVTLRHKMLAGTTSATTFKIRGGAGVAGTTTFNGSNGGRKFGGNMASSITITETAP